MPSFNDDAHLVSSLGIKPVKTPDKILQSGEEWLEQKKLVDGAEGLWRIHDDLYDFTDFIKRHPGGPDWLKVTKGTDITEAFEVHHISTGPENMLSKFRIRSAKTNRNSPFTFKEDGFYRTLKAKVRTALKGLPKQPVRTSAFFTDAACLATFVFAILAVKYDNYLLAAVSGSLLACTVIASHNYFHQKDNFRMYYWNLGFLDFREWRISHALSHHLHTNTVVDLEITNFHYIFPFLPSGKPTWKRYGSWIYGPLLWFWIFHISKAHQIYGYIKNRNNISLADFVCVLLPITMYLFGGGLFFRTLLFWNTIIALASFHFFFVGLTAAHHHPDIFHDGDTPRDQKQIDWGAAQLDAVADRYEITGSHWLVLTNFGDHALHHMFPTLDHGTLEHIYPIFKETVKDFGLNLRFTSQKTMITGQFRQLVKVEPNPNPPDLFKEMK